MDILGQTSIQAILFIVVYSITGVLPLIAALYLLLRRGNAFAPDMTPPVRGIMSTFTGKLQTKNFRYMTQT